MIQSWPVWIAAAVAVAASMVANGGLFDWSSSSSSSSSIGNRFFGPHHRHHHHHGLPPLGPLAASFLLVLLGACIGGAAVLVGLVRRESLWRQETELRKVSNTQKKLDDEDKKNSTS